jgi:hypothetical protein
MSLPNENLTEIFHVDESGLILKKIPVPKDRFKTVGDLRTLFEPPPDGVRMNLIFAGEVLQDAFNLSSLSFRTSSFLILRQEPPKCYPSVIQ